VIYFRCIDDFLDHASIEEEVLTHAFAGSDSEVVEQILPATARGRQDRGLVRK
jgi:hypothetical protein